MVAARIRRLEDEHGAGMAVPKLAHAAGEAKARDHQSAVRASKERLKGASARADAPRTKPLARPARNHRATIPMAMIPKVAR